MKWARAFEKPLRAFFVLMGIYVAIKFYVPANWEYLYTLSRVSRSVGVVLVGWLPNATLVDQPITNWSKMGKRRISFTLDVVLDSDRDRIVQSLTCIEDKLRNNEAIDQGTIMVKFNEFKESSLGILLYFFTVTTTWDEHLTVRQECNLMIMKVLEEEGIQLAVPVRKVLVQDSMTAGYKSLQQEA